MGFRFVENDDLEFSDLPVNGLESIEELSIENRILLAQLWGIASQSLNPCTECSLYSKGRKRRTLPAIWPKK